MRSVYYEDRFDAELLALCSDFERADELIRGIEWVLCRDPRFGDSVSGDSDVWAIALPDVLSIPFVIYYTFSDSAVYMLSIHPSIASMPSGEE